MLYKQRPLWQRPTHTHCLASWGVRKRVWHRFSMKLGKKEWFRNMTNTAIPYWVIWIGKMREAVFLHLLPGNSQCQWQVDACVWMCENVFYHHRNSSHNFLDEYTKTVSNMPFVTVNVSLRVTPDLKVKMPLCWFMTMTEGQQTWDNF